MNEINDLLKKMVEEHEALRAAAGHPGVDQGNLYKNPELASLASVPLTSKAIPSLLTRARLSPETRRMEERRLQLNKNRKRGPLPANRKGRHHPKTKAANKRKQQEKVRRYDFERRHGLGAILRSWGYKKIDQQMWDRYIGECFREYSPEYLEIKKIKRFPGKGSNAYYGSKDYPLTVYSFRVLHKLLGVVYDGEAQRQVDVAAGLVEDK